MKELTVKLADDLYEEVVRRAGSSRKISRYLDGLLRDAFSRPDTDLAARVAALEAQLRERTIDRESE